MKPKPKRNKPYIPKDPRTRKMQIFDMYNVLQTLEELKQSLIRGTLTTETKYDRANEGKWYNDYTQLIYLHEHTFMIQALIQDKTKEMYKDFNAIRKIIERYFDKAFSLGKNNGVDIMVPNVMPISEKSAGELIEYINNSKLVYKNLSVERYVRSLANVKSLHLTYCFVHNLSMLVMMDVDEELARLKAGGGIDIGVKKLADKLGIEL